MTATPVTPVEAGGSLLEGLGHIDAKHALSQVLEVGGVHIERAIGQTTLAQLAEDFDTLRWRQGRQFDFSTDLYSKATAKLIAKELHGWVNANGVTRSQIDWSPNHLFTNRYRGKGSGAELHRDAPNEYGLVAILTVSGVQADFLISDDKHYRVHEFEVSPGSLVLLRGQPFDPAEHQPSPQHQVQNRGSGNREVMGMTMTDPTRA
jgi:hypothetical protein